MDSLKQKAAAAKNFVERNRTKILTGALVVTTTTSAIMIRAKVEHDKFLKENDLYEEYYKMSDED